MGVLESFSLKGKVALVTGGAGQYGRQLVEAMVEAGATTFTASRDIAKLEETAKKYGATALQLDLASEESINSVMAEIIKRAGRIDILINNAVTRCACGGEFHTMAEYDESLHVNASALFYISQLAAEQMKKQGTGGSVINIGSYMGLLAHNPVNYKGTPMKVESPIYFFEKGGMANYTRFAASFYGPYNIRFNCIHPGGFFNNQPAAFLETYCANTMLGRMADDKDLKGVCVFLASDASSYLTGCNIPVDGGYSAK